MEDELRGKLNAQLSGLLHFDFASIEPPAAAPRETRSTEEADEPHREEVKAAAATAPEPEELTFQFRLFRDEEPTHTVVIQPQDEQASGTGEVGFVVPRRPMSYYVAAEPGPAAAERFRSSAVSADYLLQDARRRRWGLEKPWRVTAITITTAHPPGFRLAGSEATAAGGSGGAATGEEEEGKRKRPGKKRRITLRTRDRAKKEAEETAKKQLVDKEEHLKEKKKRLNREKKLKRRAKEREKKTATKEVDE
jgi:hypothetical protein